MIINVAPPYHLNTVTVFMTHVIRKRAATSRIVYVTIKMLRKWPKSRCAISITS